MIYNFLIKYNKYIQHYNVTVKAHRLHLLPTIK